MWSARVESMTELQGITDKLMADAGYLEMLESMNGLFMAPAEDRLGRVLTGPLDAATSKYYGVTRAAMANGKQAEAMAFGVKTAEYIGKALGTQSAFTKSGYGGFNDVTWIIGFDTRGRRRRLRRLADDRQRLPRHRRRGRRACSSRTAGTPA